MPQSEKKVPGFCPCPDRGIELAALYSRSMSLCRVATGDLLPAEDQGNAECLKCHALGGNADMPGVQCESCHGPGSVYKAMKAKSAHEVKAK